MFYLLQRKWKELLYGEPTLQSQSYGHLKYSPYSGKALLGMTEIEKRKKVSREP